MPPLLALALGSVLGGAVYPAFQPAFSATVLAAAALFGLAACAAGRAAGVIARIGLFSAGILLGMAGPAHLPDPPVLDGEWRLRGRVVTAAWGEEADVALSAIARPTGGWTPTQGRIRVAFDGTPPPPGTAVLVRGRARPLSMRMLPGAADPAWGAARSAIASEVKAIETIRIGPPPPTFRLDGAENAGLLRAMLDGERAGVPEAVATRMRRTGTWHLVSISGLHIGLSATAAWGLAWLLSRPLALVWRRGGLRWLCAAAAIAAACAYADLAGWPLPARRAAWMSAAAAVAAALRLRPGAWELLSLAWLGSAAADPAAVANPGCQLSFSALAGTLLVVPRIDRLIPPDTPRWVRWPIGGLASTLGATLGTLPTVAYTFQDLAPTAPIANLFAVPLLGTVATPALLASQLLPGFLGQLALQVADHAVSLGLAGLEPLEVAPLHPAVGLAGALLLLAAVLLRKHVVAAVSCIVLALSLCERPRGVLVVTFLDVGQGDAALVQWPEGRTWLIDGGPPGDGVLAALRRKGIRHLDAVVLSHPHPDHYGGLDPVLRELPVDEVRVPRLPHPDEAPYAALLAGTHAFRVIGARGNPNILHPLAGFDAKGNVNDESLVLRIAYGRRRFLFPGDIEAAGEAALGGRDIQADVLKVPHHGSRTSSSPAFLAGVAPEVAVIGVGTDNTYGHPNAGVLARYRATRVYRTDRDGNVEVRTDGESLEVRTERAETWVLRSRVQTVDPPRADDDGLRL